METSLCNCNQILKTTAYLAIEYQEITEERRRFSIEITASMHIRYDFDLVLKDPLVVGKVMKWMLRLGCLYQYRLAIYIGRELEEL